jgi:L-ascorbate metabolism protein UlaG (beta-lactamase superfamily)
MRPPSALRTALAAACLAGCTAVPLPREGPYHPSDADLTVTRILHGSLVLELGTTRVLVDPWFHSGVFTRQTEPLGLTPDRLPDAAAVLLTHRHPGHFDRDALVGIARKTPRAIAPPPLAQELGALGFQEVTALDWWQDTTVGPLRVTATPASHPVAENGYVVASNRVRIYVAGDTRWFDGLVDVATAFPGVDVACLPIGGERLLGFARTMGPEEAARAAALLKPRRVIPIGYGAAGAFPLVWRARKPLVRFREAVAAQGFPPEHVVVLAPGESWHYFR